MRRWASVVVVLTLATSQVVSDDLDDTSTVILSNIVWFYINPIIDFFVKIKLFLKIFRHGDRTPVDPYPTDPYLNLTYWPEGYGQLTDVCFEHFLDEDTFSNLT